MDPGLIFLIVAFVIGVLIRIALEPKISAARKRDKEEGRFDYRM